ncbi:MAG: adenylate/guanylate cyclase domain-containing protein [Vicinamibacterales bacterium]|nr:adenylate/guanylate cyclase domain-containing protein [Vicinamibacterales bacterium]
MLIGLLRGAAAAAVACLLGLLPFAQTIELKTYDRRLAATAGPAIERDDIVLVTINDDSLQRLEPIVGRWPWPRLVHATLVDFLARAPAKLIVYDVLFAEADRRQFDLGGETWSGEESDAALVDATARAGRVIHVAEASSEGLIDRSRELPIAFEDLPTLRPPGGLAGVFEERPRLTPPFPALARAAHAVGHTFLILDPDGPVRRYAPFVEVQGRLVPSLGVAAAIAVAPAAPAVAGDTLQIGAARVPLVTQAVADYYGVDRTARRALVPYRGPSMRADGTPAFPRYSFYDLFFAEQQILEGLPPHIPPDVFKDRIVFVGATAQGLRDSFAVPYGEGEMPGPEIHAHILDGLLAPRAIGPAPAGTAAGAALLMALAVALVSTIRSPWAALGAGALLAAAWVWAGVSLFAGGVWIPFVVPLLAGALAVSTEFAWHYLVEGREKRRVKRLFSRYVSKDVFDQLMADPSRASLGGTRREMTVLFSDVRGFTALSERGEPEEIVRQLNEYFSRMVEVVFAHQGTIDKFVGDMVMALFGAPLDDPRHADHAVAAALGMETALEELNARWTAEGRATLDIGIGINTGEMVAGNIGSESIMSYTVIGDSVNLGARLESLTKEYGARIIISARTRDRLQGRYDIRPLGEVVVKGRTEAVAIYQVTAPPVQGERGEDRS